uniref:NADH-ubiquinone oxidoreductase chain 2 n=1 Tax=Chthamalus malayensis TaxID=316610 RepID=A0A7T7CQF0_CHTMA|nr:NADH dehydrogenase subunit 2 [Chthamalus malayensis]QQK92492.1 NADH dehydrogenase subunit 2 [Chthamalus malayensis]
MNFTFPPLIYSFFLILGTLISISSSSLFGMWMGLEVNLMSFIPLIINLENNKKSSEAAIKYFLVQAVASAVVIFSSLFFFLFNGTFVSLGFNLVFTLSLLIKLGMAPLHFWFPEVIEGLNWVNSMVLLTWQKISPLVILSLFFNPQILIFGSLASAVVGAVSGFNQTSFRKILAFSSISHLGWMGSLMYLNKSLWIDYYFVYVLTSFIICLSFWFFSLNYFSQLCLMKDLKKKFMVFINMLSLGGLPPLLGFFPKWTAMMVLMSNIPVLMILIASSLVTLYFYTRMCFSTFTLFIQNLLWFHLESLEKKFYLLSFFTFISLIGIFPFSFFSI